jgi:hypothetical protein
LYALTGSEEYASLRPGALYLDNFAIPNLHIHSSAFSNQSKSEDSRARLFIVA